MDFSGFTPDQFDVFGIPAFGDRMSAIRSLVRPQLVALGEALAPAFSEAAGHPLFPKTALHGRRRVNPPDDTWVAFSRSDKGYKAYAHFEVGISYEGIYVALVLKDEAIEDRARLGRRMESNPDRAVKMAHKIRKFRLEEWKNKPMGAAATADFLKLGDSLISRKTATLHLFGDIERHDPRLADPAAFVHLAPEMVRPLLPFYRWALPED